MAPLGAALGLQAASSAFNAPNYAPAFLAFQFFWAHGILSSRTLKQWYGIDHNESPRYDLDKYGDEAVRTGRITQKQLNMLRRNESAHANAIENYAFFAGAIGFATFAGVDRQLINRAGLVYTLARIGHGARLLYGYLKHHHFEPSSTPRLDKGPLRVFQPSAYSVSTPPGDLDFTLHKSNSTYFADLDIARGHHFFGLFHVGIQKYSKKARVFPVLGAVASTFRKEIRPFARAKIWTRVLSWDSKWIYLVSHFVPEAPIRSSRADQASAATTRQPLVYATCVSKIVVKQGRQTIVPDEFLAACGLLPESSGDGSGFEAGPASGAYSRQAPRVVLEGSQVEHTAQSVEERKRSGIALAGHIAALDDGLEWLKGPDEIPFAEY
ncbi:MAG: hypothetical protein Q9165_007271 [Trypethelium subeluteriae]